jgi:hypothetical protein
MKTIILIITGLILLSLLIVAFSKSKKKTDTSLKMTKEPDIPSISGQSFVDTLTELGYFKYTDTKNLDTLKKEIETVFDQVKVLTTVSNEKNLFNAIATDFIAVMEKHYLNLAELTIT